MESKSASTGAAIKIITQDQASTSVLLPRLTLGLIISTAILLPSLYDPLLSSTWDYLYNSPTYQFSGIETIETILFYILMEIIYNLYFYYNPTLRIDIRNPNGKFPGGTISTPLPKTMRWPSARLPELLTYILPLFMLDFTLIKKYADVPVTAILASGNYHSSPGIKPRGCNETTTTTISPSFLLPTFHNFSLSSPLQLHRALPTSPPNSRRLTLELFSSIFIYDFLFFLLHWALHTIPFLAAYHRPHHRHGEMNPQITNQLSVFERLSLVLLANFSLNIIGSHVLTRTVFIPLFVWLLVEIHSGMELEWSYDRLLPARWGSGARKHARHHRDGSGGFEPFFTWWDGALEGTQRLLARSM